MCSLAVQFASGCATLLTATLHIKPHLTYAATAPRASEIPHIPQIKVAACVGESRRAEARCVMETGADPGRHGSVAVWQCSQVSSSLEAEAPLKRHSHGPNGIEASRHVLSLCLPCAVCRAAGRCARHARSGHLRSSFSFPPVAILPVQQPTSAQTARSCWARDKASPWAANMTSQCVAHSVFVNVFDLAARQLTPRPEAGSLW